LVDRRDQPVHIRTDSFGCGGKILRAQPARGADQIKSDERAKSEATDVKILFHSGKEFIMTKKYGRRQAAWCGEFVL
jgi:hypothetical protein